MSLDAYDYADLAETEAVLLIYMECQERKQGHSNDLGDMGSNVRYNDEVEGACSSI